jgi:hypothetical protein
MCFSLLILLTKSEFQLLLKAPILNLFRFNVLPLLLGKITFIVCSEHIHCFEDIVLLYVLSSAECIFVDYILF